MNRERWCNGMAGLVRVALCQLTLGADERTCTHSSSDIRAAEEQYKQGKCSACQIGSNGREEEGPRKERLRSEACAEVISSFWLHRFGLDQHRDADVAGPGRAGKGDTDGGPGRCAK